MKNSIDTVRVNISLPKKLHKQYAKEALQAQMSFSAYVRKALLEHELCVEKGGSATSSSSKKNG